MECNICYQDYDDESKKPLALQPCSHTFCIECLNKLKTNKCPLCNKIIVDKKPNYGLIEVLSKLMTPEKRLKKDIETKLKSTFENMKMLDDTNKICIYELDEMKKQIRAKTESLVQSLKLQQDYLIKKINSIQNRYNQEYEIFIQNKTLILDELILISDNLSETSDYNSLKILDEKLNNIDIQSKKVKKITNKYMFKEDVNNVSIGNVEEVAPIVNKIELPIIRGECIKTLKGHSKSIYSLARLSNDRIVSASLDKTIKIWDFSTGQCVKTLTGHTGEVNSLKILSNDRIISGSKDNTIKIWDSSNGKCIKTLTGHTNGICSLAILLNDEIVSGGYDNLIKIWNSNTGECIRTLFGHTSGIYALAILSNNQIVSGSIDNSIKIWNLNTNECIKTINSKSGTIYSLAILSNDLIVSGNGDKTIKIWDSNTGECLKTLSGHSKPVYSLAILSNRILSSSGDETIKIWNYPDSIDCLKTLKHSGNVYSLVILSNNQIVSASGNHFLDFNSDLSIKIWS